MYISHVISDRQTKIWTHGQKNNNNYTHKNKPLSSILSWEVNGKELFSTGYFFRKHFYDNWSPLRNRNVVSETTLTLVNWRQEKHKRKGSANHFFLSLTRVKWQYHYNIDLKRNLNSTWFCLYVHGIQISWESFLSCLWVASLWQSSGCCTPSVCREKFPWIVSLWPSSRTV